MLDYKVLKKNNNKLVDAMITYIFKKCKIQFTKSGIYAAYNNENYVHLLI